MKNKSRKIKISSNKNFGIVFFIFFIIVSVWLFFKNGEFIIWPIIVAVVFLILGLTNSKLLTPLNKAWNQFGILLGNFIAPIVMGIIFFLVVTPTGLVVRVMGKDLLRLKKNKDKKTYWIHKDDYKTSMKNQF
tara:strand:+ start:183 stop:581 length:399 start_codon:yes stop_codon:yes gene_type:complete